MQKKSILQIAIPTPLRQTFDYLPLPDISDYQLGQRVKVSFGRRELIGVIIGFSQNSDFPLNKLKSIIEVIDRESLFDEKLLSLYRWASDYYQHPIGDVILGSLPKKIRDGLNAKFTTECGDLRETIEELKSTKACGDTPETIEELKFARTCGDAREAIEESKSTMVFRPTKRSELVLTEEQQHAVEQITAATHHFQPFLLSGVTGSGKTEVYLRVIADVLKNNKQALVLVPEIALTPQTVARFEARFNVPVLLLHSGLSPKKRITAWMSATQNNPCIVIGTRSAVFAPLKNLGVIVIDEEHDISFKQQSGFRYSARDLAVIRAKMTEIPVVLGTATPSLESLKNSNQEKYILLTLSERAGNATLPPIKLHNICGEKLHQGLSPELIKIMQKHLEKNNQILLFLNRRGYAPVLICHQCGWFAVCKHCDARLTLHENPKRLICHHRGYHSPVIRVCTSCKQSELTALGLGTEQLEETVKQLFPHKKTCRVDRDNVKSFSQLEKTLLQVHNQEVDILIGTQMLVKGHHFENVTLVAALDVDNALFSSDFRAVERLGQSLIQVAGRAGRADKIGEVFIQTHHPENPSLQKLFQSGYLEFANMLLIERAQAQLPPYAHMTVLRAEAKDKMRVQKFLEQAKNKISQQGSSVQIAGP
ncbi:MAG: primosomal protein N', partial [Gammaproteobacteria bacterium]|nr:primosomal protein N' [Gammaproteobacteria bacterium]